MKAIVWTEYGPPEVLQLRDVAKPVPKDNEVLIRICATTVTSGDCEQRGMYVAFRYRPFMRLMIGFKRPTRITMLGMELAGEIEAVGRDASRFKEGDQVFAATSFIGMGTCAEYICLPEETEGGALAIKPANMTYEEAAPVPVGGLEALHYIRLGNIRQGQKALVNGAGGTIGTFAVQLARYFGAEVTGVDSADKLDMLRSIGADHVIDYTQEDFTRGGETYDFILDIAGKSSFSGRMRALTQEGRYVIADPGLLQMTLGRLTGMISRKKMMAGGVSPKAEDLVFLKELIEAGEIKSVIDRCYPLEQVPEAHRYVETGDKKGHVVITVEHNNKT
ncbi:MAG: NAD(P)-dependent alcohol dehydrogenase [Dehalococcoidales bacterium]|nr:MAG: NAD(P)-dependent alcohol dehydrogenase [Dehalococcoidales bacterium]